METYFDTLPDDMIMLIEDYLYLDETFNFALILNDRLSEKILYKLNSDIYNIVLQRKPDDILWKSILNIYLYFVIHVEHFEQESHELFKNGIFEYFNYYV